MSMFLISKLLIVLAITICGVNLVVLIGQKPTHEQKYVYTIAFLLLLNFIGHYFCLRGDAESLVIMGLKIQYISMAALYMSLLGIIQHVYNIQFPRLFWSLLGTWLTFIIVLAIFANRYSRLGISHWLFKGYTFLYDSSQYRYMAVIDCGWAMYALRGTVVAYSLFIIGLFMYRLANSRKGGERRDILLFLIIVILPLLTQMGTYLVDYHRYGFPYFPAVSALSVSFASILVIRERFNNLHDLALDVVEDAVESPLFILDDRLRVQDTNGAGSFLFKEYQVLNRKHRFLKANTFLQDCITPPLDCNDGNPSFIPVDGKIYAPEVRRVERHDHLYGFVVTLKDITSQHDMYVRLEESNALLIKNMSRHRDDVATIHGKLVSGAIQFVLSLNKETGEHMRRTSNYTYVLARELQNAHKFADILTDEYVETLTQVAPLHDIGKFLVAKAIVDKRYGLNEEEERSMQEHVRYGADIVDKMIVNNNEDLFYTIAREVTLNHHEHWDGSGYPLHLKGKEIPLSARIVAVADMFDSLSFSYSTDKSLSFQDVFAKVLSFSGTKFDPDVVDAFKKSRSQFADLCGQVFGRA